MLLTALPVREGQAATLPVLVQVLEGQLELSMERAELVEMEITLRAAAEAEAEAVAVLDNQSVLQVLLLQV